MNQFEKVERLHRDVAEKVAYCRGVILDIVEQELGSQDNWEFIRNRVLKAMGDRGLAGSLREAISAELAQGGVQ